MELIHEKSILEMAVCTCAKDITNGVCSICIVGLPKQEEDAVEMGDEINYYKYVGSRKTSGDKEIKALPYHSIDQTFTLHECSRVANKAVGRY